MSEVLIVRKRGSGNRLLNTETQQIVTLAEIQALLEGGRNVRVLERPGDRDITTATMLQVLERAEREAQRLPASLVADLVRYRASTQLMGP